MTDVAKVIRWEAPPDRRAVRVSRWQAVADELRTRPHQWALLLEGSNSTACSQLVQQIKTGQEPFDPRGAFEALSRSTRRGEGNQVVYARYVVGEEPSKPGGDS